MAKRLHPDDVLDMLKDALVRKRSGLPSLVDDDELLEHALGAIEDLDGGYATSNSSGCDCFCHEEG